MKVSGSYESVVRGVSEQVPQERRSGQMAAQENMISDPVRGLTRRQGSRLLDEQSVAGTFATRLADTKSHKVSTFYIEGVEYDLIHRTTAALADSDSFLWAFNRATGQFIPVQRPAVDATLDLLISGGVSASTGVGRYAYIAGNSIVPAYTATEHHNNATNLRKAVAWVRGGAYSRTFKVKLKLDTGATITGSYKTVSASYPELLDTSDILASDTEYQKKVNDRVYAYNSEVTAWIGIAAEDITPENIATQIATSLTTAGIVGVSVIGGTVCIDDSRVVEATGEDGGDGSLLRAVGAEVTAPELVSTHHWVGKVVKVKPQRAKADDAFYLKAEAKIEGTTGFAEVAWRECAGYEMQPTVVFAMATVLDGTLYIAGDPAKLATLTGLTVPGYEPNAVGDAVSNPLPAFFGKRITYLGVFQDRLIIGAGAVINASRPGDYTNNFRQSVLSVLDSDPVEVYALGAEDDVITHGTTFDRDLILYGRRFQYAITGRAVLTPKTASIVTASAYKDATDAAPKASGNYVFYAKYSTDEDSLTATTSLNQVMAGPIAESPESFDISQQLSTYLQGRPLEIVALTNPNMVVLRTDAVRDGLYTYGYLDGPGNERLLDNWSRWRWHPAVGSLVGVTNNKGTLLVYLLRQRNGSTYIACERFVVDSALATLPYADSLQTLAEADANPTMTGTTGAIVALARDGGNFAFMGSLYNDSALFRTKYSTELARAWVGFPADAYVTPTNPYFKDSNGRPVLDGRMTLSQVGVSVADTAGMYGIVDSTNGTSTPIKFEGRILGSKANILGQQPIINTRLTMTVGKEIRECSYTLKSKDWLPLTITAIEWTGQVFNRKRRV